MKEYCQPMIIVARDAYGLSEGQGPGTEGLPCLSNSWTPCEKVLRAGVTVAAQAAWAEIVCERGQGHVA